MLLWNPKEEKFFIWRSWIVEQLTLSITIQGFQCIFQIDKSDNQKKRKWKKCNEPVVQWKCNTFSNDNNALFLFTIFRAGKYGKINWTRKKQDMGEGPQ